jgi:hypothetical protein
MVEAVTDTATLAAESELTSTARKHPLALLTTLTAGLADGRLQKLVAVTGASVGMLDTVMAVTGAWTASPVRGAVLKMLGDWM